MVLPAITLLILFDDLFKSEDFFEKVFLFTWLKHYGQLNIIRCFACRVAKEMVK